MKTIQNFYNRHKTNIAVSPLYLAILLILSIFILASTPYYYSPLEGKWYELGKNATLTIQLGGTNTLCHQGKTETEIICYNIEGGIHGLLADDVKLIEER